MLSHLINSRTIFSSLIFLITSFAWSCSSLELIYEEKNISRLEEKLEKVQYDYSFLSEKKYNNSIRKKRLNDCLEQKKTKIQLIKNILNNQIQTNVLSGSKVDDLKITLNTLKDEFLKNEILIVKAINLELEIDQKILLAQNFQFKNNNRKNIFELIDMHQKINQSLSSINAKPLDEIFYFLASTFKDHFILMVMVLAISFIISLMLTRFVKVNLLKHNLYMVYKNIHFFLPFYGFLIFPYIYFEYETLNWLNQPPMIILIRWFLNVMTIQILVCVYIYLHVEIPDYQDRLYRRMHLIINGLLIYSFIQFAGLNFFEESYLVDLIYLLVFNNFFFIYFFYQGTQFILLLTNPKFHQHSNLKKLRFYRYAGIVILFNYLFFLMCFIYMGYQRFSTAQVLYALVLLLYVIKFIKFEQKLIVGNYTWANTWIKLIKNQFGVTLKNNIWQINTLILILNIYIIFGYFLFCLQILAVPEPIISSFKNLLFDFKKFGFIEISLNSLLSTIGLFSAVMLIGKYLTHQILMQEDYQKDLDKSYRYQLLIEYSFLLFSIVISLLFLGVNPVHLSFIVGTLGLGLSVGMQTIIKEFFAGIMILGKRIISLGDYIQIQGGSNSTTGKVYKISTFSTQIYTEEQLLLTVPNSTILGNGLINFTKSEAIEICYIYLPIKNMPNYDKVVERVLKVLRSFSEIHQELPFDPQVKLCNYSHFKIEDIRSLSIQYYVDNLTLKKEIYTKVKKALMKELHKEIIN